MKHRVSFFLFLSSGFLWMLTPAPASADSGHARIVRLSLVQGDVRFTPQFHKDSLDDSKAVWEIAPLNLPIRQGYALATDANGRAEVEFENGAMAFLSANTLIEFYDLSLDDGAHITRLILRQGSGIFYVHPAQGDYFSVTGGDFSVEANGRTRFRLDNFDDGSHVNVEQGQINVLRNKTSKALEKGQSYSINVTDGSAPVIGRAADYDDFDKWVSGRIDSVATATAYSSQYLSSPSYTSGFADLYNYGSFYNIPGYGYGWQPYGVGLGWDPFAFGTWYSDPSVGWNFIGFAPWGWLPYHYGGWVFSPVFGWVWMPTGFRTGGPVYYHPATAVWVRSGTTTGLVPLHPADGYSKPPINLAQGVYTLHGNVLAATPTSGAGENWTVIKTLPRNTIPVSSLAVTTQPTRVSRTILSSSYGSRPVTLSRDSSIVYDPAQHRFVNGNSPAKVTLDETKVSVGNSTGTRATTNAAVGDAFVHAPSVPAVAHGNTVLVRPHITPPTPPPGNLSRSLGASPAIWNHSSVGSGSSIDSSRSTASSTGGHASGGGHH